MKVIGVRFRKAGKIYYYNPNGLVVKNGNQVIVETPRGIEIGFVVYENKEINEEELLYPLTDVIRVANEEDIKKDLELKEKEGEAFTICLHKIKEHKLEMHLIDTEFTFDEKKLIFYFTADRRIDFRDLVRDLASIFRIRIELRQIGVRDEAKLLGGIGPCGRTLCCNTFLAEFQPVSIKMAKDQDLSLNPSKISGVCGRLMCCLKHEYDNYSEIIDKMPVEGMKVETPIGEGIVVSISILLELVKVQIQMPDGTEEILPFLVQEIEFDREEVQKLKEFRYDMKKLAKLEGIDNYDVDLLEELMKDD